ncbi:hypothetical protein ACOBV9_19095 (plasmid) [Pseudoalteromonas espejiana]
MDTQSDTTQVDISYKINDNFSFDIFTCLYGLRMGLQAYEALASAESDVSMDEKISLLFLN